MASFDANTWYQITESRVGFTSALQLFGGSEVGFYSFNESNPKDLWQIRPLSSNTVAFRLQDPGPFMQLSACYVPDEVDPSKTEPCLQNTNYSDPAQQWTIQTWGDGTLRINNVANGTAYNMDCHPGNPVFMSSTTAAEPIEPGQHWLIQSFGLIDDTSYSVSTSATSSSAPATNPTPTPVPTPAHNPNPSSAITVYPYPATATSTHTSAKTQSATSNPTAIAATYPSPSTSSSSNSGFSTGAAAGIGVGAGLAVFLVAALLFLWVFRRRRANQNNLPAHPYKIVEHDQNELAMLDNTERKIMYEAPALEMRNELDASDKAPGSGLSELEGSFRRS